MPSYGITLAQAQAKLAEYMAAETAVMAGQSYTINGRELRRADLKTIQDGVTQWDARCNELGARQAGGSRRRIVRAV